MALPGFIGVGAAKSGTTMLFQLMSQHRDIFIPRQKECHFFNSDELYGYGAHYYEARFFTGHISEKICGEITPLYMLYEDVPGRIMQTLGPEIKLVFCFRNPAKRAFSNYLQNVRMLWEGESFPRALELESERLAADYRFGLIRAYIHGGYYSQQLTNFLRLFPRENLFIIIFEEDMFNNREKTFSRLLSFLEVGEDDKVNFKVSGNKSLPPKLQIVEDKPLFCKQNNRRIKLPAGTIIFTTGFPGIDRIIINPSPNTSQYFNKLRDVLTTKIDKQYEADLIQRYFMQDIKQLEDLIDRDLSVWYQY
jgi:hypothetical protein